jgi:hypothetical protein
MGRDKPKKRMNWMQKSAYLKSQASKYGISQSDFQDDEGNHKDRLDGFLGSSQSMEDAVVKAMNADYDMRESLKYGIDSGNKHFKDTTSGISNINEAVNAHRAIQKYGKKDLKHKNTSSANDYADISHNLFNESRDKFSEGIMSDIDDEQTDAAIKPDDNEVPYEESQQSKDAQATLEKWKAGFGAGGSMSPYGASSASAPDVPSPYKTESSKPVTTDVDEFVDGYKKDVKSAYNIKPVMS